jgi:cytochrome c peroxidase
MRIVLNGKTSLLTLFMVIALSGCHPHDDKNLENQSAIPHTTKPTQPKPLSLMAQIGKKLFYEPSLSASGKMSCASCHSPSHEFGPPNALAVQLGGHDLTLQGIRAVPKLTYMLETPNFTVGPEDSGGTEPHPLTNIPANTSAASANPFARAASGLSKASNLANSATALVPQGGFFWDGRDDTLQGQALGPLLNPLEMGNKSTDEIVHKLQKLAYVNDFKTLAGSNVINDKKLLLSEALFAIARYESEEKSFAPYNSKYDYYLQGKIKLSDAEMRGLKLFDDPKKGNCSSCHLDKTTDGHPPMFTDYQFEGLGVPRNLEIKANRNPNYYDLGICGPSRHDAYAQQDSNCGLFKTPSLRNVATRHVFFHNGKYHNLEDVLHFYVERDIHPEKFYPKKSDGSIDKFNDLTAKYRANIDIIDAPLNRKLGEQPALNDAEIKDVITFLNTLTDGHQ